MADEYRVWLTLADGKGISPEGLLAAAERAHSQAGPVTSAVGDRARLALAVDAPDITRAVMVGWQLASDVLAAAELPRDDLVGFEIELVSDERLRVRVRYYPDDYAESAADSRDIRRGAFVATLDGRGAAGRGLTADEAIAGLAAELRSSLEGVTARSELDGRLARNAADGDLVDALRAAADEPLLAESELPEAVPSVERGEAVEMHVAELCCPSCAAQYQAVGFESELEALGCWFCPSLLTELSGFDRYAAPDHQPARGRPVVQLVLRPG